MGVIIIKALIAGLGISLIAGLLGCFVVWKRMAYFSDSLAHCSLLGIALGIMLSINSNISVFIVSIFFAILLSYMQHKVDISTDTLLGILSHGSLSIGMIMMTLLGNDHFDLHDFLFGDIMKVSVYEIVVIYIVFFISYAVIYLSWPKLLLLTLSKDLAESHNINSLWYQSILTILLMLAVVVSIKIAGLLLITSMFVTPPSISRLISKNPLQMVLFSILHTISSVFIGIIVSYYSHLPAGPTIVVIMILNLIATIIYKKYKKLA
jgi:zinc transport system permease protein